VSTPTGHKYEGVRSEKGNCGVSIMRSGRQLLFRSGKGWCCRSVTPQCEHGCSWVAEDKFSSKGRGEIINISLLPLSGTGNTVIEAVKVLVEHGVQPSVIILLSLFSTPHGKLGLLPSFEWCQIYHPGIPFLMTHVHPVLPTHSGHKYVRTD
ncbi:UPP phosphoribosyltransferase, partial [Eolophus roseicapillus]|nr:UPP phosphoribosyltransferase [Eolophus roseicapilla]